MKTNLTNKQYLFVQGIIAGLTNTEAAKQAGYKGNDTQLAITANKNLNKAKITAQIEQHKAEIKEITNIKVIDLQRKLMETGNKALENGRYAAAVSAYSAVIKTIGGFQQDRIPPENLRAKELDAQKASDMKAIADRYYSEKYLARPVESTSKDVVNSGQTDDESGIPEEFRTEDDFSQEDPYDPPRGRP